MLEQIINAYNEAIPGIDREQALKVIHDAVALGVSPEDVVFRIVVPSIEQMVKAISEDLDADLARHFMIYQIAVEVTENMLPRFKASTMGAGRVVIGTAEGDLHSFAKSIVIGCLKARMVETIDLGVNIPPERFVDAAVACNAQVIVISAMMAHTAQGKNGCLKVRQLLRERGLEGRIRIVVGGTPFRVDPELYKSVQADAWAEDGISAGKIIIDLIREVNP